MYPKYLLITVIEAGICLNSTLLTWFVENYTSGKLFEFNNNTYISMTILGFKDYT